MRLYRVTYKWNDRVYNRRIRVSWHDLLVWVNHLVRAGAQNIQVS